MTLCKDCNLAELCQEFRRPIDHLAPDGAYLEIIGCDVKRLYLWRRDPGTDPAGKVTMTCTYMDQTRDRCTYHRPREPCVRRLQPADVQRAATQRKTTIDLYGPPRYARSTTGGRP